MPHTRQDLTQGQLTQRSDYNGGWGGEGPAQAEARTVLDYAGHRLT